MPAYKLLLEFANLNELKGYVADLADRPYPPIPGIFGNTVAPADSPPVSTGAEVTAASAVSEEKPRVAGGGFRKKKVKDDAKEDSGDISKNEAVHAVPAGALTAPPAEEIPYETVQKATMTYHQGFGREKTLALLGEFGVKIATDLKQAQYRGYLDRVSELTAQGKEGALA